MPDWKIYRTRFLVKATKLTQSAVIVDERGKFQTGQPGDYLVQCSNGTQRISPRHVFEDVYVEMSSGANASPSPGSSKCPYRLGIRPVKV